MATLLDFMNTQLDADTRVAHDALDAAMNHGMRPRTATLHRDNEDLGQPSSFELRFEPEAVLADLAARQAIVDQYETALANAAAETDPTRMAIAAAVVTALETAVTHLASAYFPGPGLDHTPDEA